MAIYEDLKALPAPGVRLFIRSLVESKMKLIGVFSLLLNALFAHGFICTPLPARPNSSGESRITQLPRQEINGRKVIPAGVDAFATQRPASRVLPVSRASFRDNSGNAVDSRQGRTLMTHNAVSKRSLRTHSRIKTSPLLCYFSPIQCIFSMKLRPPALFNTNTRGTGSSYRHWLGRVILKTFWRV